MVQALEWESNFLIGMTVRSTKSRFRRTAAEGLYRVIGVAVLPSVQKSEARVVDSTCRAIIKNW